MSVPGGGGGWGVGGGGWGGGGGGWVGVGWGVGGWGGGGGGGGGGWTQNPNLRIYVQCSNQMSLLCTANGINVYVCITCDILMVKTVECKSLGAC